MGKVRQITVLICTQREKNTNINGMKTVSPQPPFFFSCFRTSWLLTTGQHGSFSGAEETTAMTEETSLWVTGQSNYSNMEDFKFKKWMGVASTGPTFLYSAHPIKLLCFSFHFYCIFVICKMKSIFLNWLYVQFAFLNLFICIFIIPHFMCRLVCARLHQTGCFPSNELLVALLASLVLMYLMNDLQS